MNITNDMLADEDMRILKMIAKSLVERYPTFRINLPHNVYLTNSVTRTTLVFTGLDQLKLAKEKIMRLNLSEKYQLVMPTTTLQRTEVGEIFGMVVVADPTCPPEKFLIQPYEKAS